jgi:acyl-CoA synthetase (AMP-forming)/AMP-acid ligase II
VLGDTRLSSRLLVLGLNNLLFHAPYRGVPVVILPRFEPIAFLSAVSRYKATVALVVPPILLMLLHHPGACSRADLHAKANYKGGHVQKRQIMICAP